MKPRALIIAIENYSEAEGLFTQKLEGTIASACRFYQWLLVEKHLEAECIFLCSDGNIAPDHPLTRSDRTGNAGRVKLVRGGARADIIAATLDLIDLGQDETSELFVFFSGHGLAYKESPWRLALDVLIGGDFRNFRESGAACLKLDELRVRLCTCLGGTDHYFLIDACRNVVDTAQFQPVGLGISPTAAQLGTPTVYTLYSVKYGEPAPVNPKFANALLSGLNGDGHAKGWVQGQMFVKFDLVRDYVKDKVQPRQIDYHQEGDGKGTLLQLPPPVMSRCQILVVDAFPSQKFHLKVFSGTNPVLDADFTGEAFATSLEPNDRTYILQVVEDGEYLEQVDPPAAVPLDLYNDTTVKFRHRRIDRSGAERVDRVATPELPAAEARVHVLFSPDQGFAGCAPNWSLQLRNLSSGDLWQKTSSFERKVAPGKYLAKVLENGVTATSVEFDISPGETKTIDLLNRKATPFQQAFLEQVVGRPDARVPDFSEVLGPSANWNPQLWLAYLGGAHIVRKPGAYRRLGNIPLQPLDNLDQGDAAVFVLSAVEGAVPEVAVTTAGNVRWSPMTRVEGVPTLCEAQVSVAAGSALFSVKFENFTPITYATCAIPNRVTLFTLSKEAEGPLRMQQFFLVPSKLQSVLPNQLRWDSLPVSDLKIIQFMSLAQSQFSRRRSILPEGAQGEISDFANLWQMVLDAKWVDPLLSLIALYDIVRRGGAKVPSQSALAMLDAAERYLPEVPDLWVLQQLLRKSAAFFQGTPLFLEGVLSSQAASAGLPLPSDRLDFNTVWTSWHDAVELEDLGQGTTTISSA